jgi:hypothetical protein
METEPIALNQRERDRLKVLHEVQEKHLSDVKRITRGFRGTGSLEL